MVQRIRSFEEGCRRGLGIVVRCDRCAKKVKYLCRDFEGYIAPNAEIEELTWRCAWCKAVATWVRYTMIDVNNREGLAQWTPPPWMKRRWPVGINEITDRRRGTRPTDAGSD